MGRQNSPGLELMSGLPYFSLEQPIYQTIFIDSLKNYDIANYYYIKFACVADISLKYYIVSCRADFHITLVYYYISSY